MAGVSDIIQCGLVDKLLSTCVKCEIGELSLIAADCKFDNGPFEPCRQNVIIMMILLMYVINY